MVLGAQPVPRDADTKSSKGKGGAGSQEGDGERTGADFSCHRDALKLGFSKPWPEAMQLITGQPNMSAEALMSYFEPLMTWLEKENQKNGEVLGWPEYSWTPYTAQQDDSSKTDFLGMSLTQSQATAGGWVLLALALLFLITTIFFGVKFFLVRGKAFTSISEMELK
ncbi:hypothetical protein EK904_000355 [Melospiza melodia maxima]|nr:hypothetical protein EK904_000355 [Melospiza melodia maxima]